MIKIDALKQVRDMEAALRASDDPRHCGDYLIALWRWQWDDMMDDATREAARKVVRELAPGWSSFEFLFPP